MALSTSGIDYLTHVWNPVVGCNRGCDYCWARRLCKRMRCSWCAAYRPHFHEDRLTIPRGKPKRIGLGFLSDLFDDLWPDGWDEYSGWPAERISRQIYRKVQAYPEHQFLTLTRCPEGIPDHTDWPDNWWIGVTVTTWDESDSLILELLASGVPHPWVSIEPMLEGLVLTPCWLLGRPWIDWVVVGGRSGPGAPSLDPDWVRSIRDQCVRAGVPFYFKQWADPRKRQEHPPLLDGRTWRQLPAGLLLPGEEET